MNTFNKGEPENPGRRGFFGVVGKVAAVVAGATAVGIEGNQYYKKEKELNELHESLKGQENNPSKAVEVIDRLLAEMNKANPTLENVKVSGTGTPSEAIDVLRDFLTSYINSSIGRSHYLGDDAIASGVYTKENLAALREKSSKIAKK